MSLLPKMPSTKKIEQLEILVDHLKEEKRKTRREFAQHLREFSQQYTKTSIEFLERSTELSNPSYLFVNQKGDIIGYTSQLAKMLNIEEDTRGKNYLELFDLPEDKANIRSSIRKYFATREEREVTYEATIKGKKRNLKITKEIPIYCHDIDLISLGRTGKRDIVAFIPIKIEIQGYFSRHKPEELLKLMEAQNGETTKMYHDLITQHKWTSEQIMEYEKKHGGAEGLRKHYHQLEKIPIPSPASPSAKTNTKS